MKHHVNYTSEPFLVEVIEGFKVKGKRPLKIGEIHEEGTVLLRERFPDFNFNFKQNTYVLPLSDTSVAWCADLETLRGLAMLHNLDG